MHFHAKNYTYRYIENVDWVVVGCLYSVNWNGLLDHWNDYWNTGMDYWNTGMDYWNTGMDYWPYLTCAQDGKGGAWTVQ